MVWTCQSTNSGIKRPDGAQHLKAPVPFMICSHSQAIALNPSVKSSVGAYRRAIGDALEREALHFRILLQHSIIKSSRNPQRGRQAYVQRFDEQYGDVLAIASGPQPKSLSNWRG